MLSWKHVEVCHCKQPAAGFHCSCMCLLLQLLQLGRTLRKQSQPSFALCTSLAFRSLLSSSTRLLTVQQHRAGSQPGDDPGKQAKSRSASSSYCLGSLCACASRRLTDSNLGGRAYQQWQLTVSSAHHVSGTNGIYCRPLASDTAAHATCIYAASSLQL